MSLLVAFVGALFVYVVLKSLFEETTDEDDWS